MAYEIQVSATNYTITSSSTEYSVTVSSPATANFTITNNLSTVTITKLNTTASIYTDAVELILGNLNDFWRGSWSGSASYIRGDIVDYQYSQYFLSNFDPNPLTPYTSATPPSQDATWIRFNWHEAPFAILTVTNTATFNLDAIISRNLTVGGDVSIGGGAGGNGLTINSTATFNGRSFFNSTATFNSGVNLTNADLEVSSLVLNGKNLVRTKTTGTSTLSIGLTEGNFVTSGPWIGGGPPGSNSYKIFKNEQNIGYAESTYINFVKGVQSNTGIFDNTLGVFRWALDNDIQVAQNYAAIEVAAKGPTGLVDSNLVNAVIANTSTVKLSARTSRNGGDPYANGVVDWKVGPPYAEIGVSSTGTNQISSYVFLDQDNGIRLKAWKRPSTGFSPYQGASAITLNTTTLTLETIPYDVNLPTTNASSITLHSGVGYGANSKGIITAEAQSIIIKPTRNDSYETGVYIVPGSNSPVGGGYSPARFAIGSSITQLPNSPPYITSSDSIFDVGFYSPSNAGISYIISQPQRVFIRPTEYADANTPVFNFTTSTQVQIGVSGSYTPTAGRAGTLTVPKIFGISTNRVEFPNGITMGSTGIRFANTTTVQTVPFEGYDQGLL